MKTAANIFLKIIFIIVLQGDGIIAAMAQDEPQALPQSAKKEIPRITFKNLSPPFTDFDYFQGHQEYPFQVQATSFSLINAWWLAEASTLVYADEDFVKARFSHPGTSKVVYDTLEEDAISRKMATIIPEFNKTAKNELQIINAYLIPNEDMMNTAHKLIQKGVKIKIITNSLASQDVPAVNSHYGPWRKPILEAGIELYELRPDAAIKTQTDIIQKYKGKRGTTYAVKYKDPLTKQTKHYKSFKRFKEANEARNDLRSLLDSGKLPKKERKFTPITFDEVAASLRIEWSGRHNRGELADKTFYEYNNRLDIVCRTFGRKLLIEITEAEIKSHVRIITEDLTNVTANKTLSIIKKVFVHGLGLKAIIKDIASEIEYLSEKEHERNNFLLPSQVAVLIDATQKTRSKFYMPAMIFLGAEHGAAKQEILSLEWSDIDFDFKVKGLIKLYRTKNKRERTELMMPRTKQALLDWKSHLEYKRKRAKVTKAKSDHVFCRIDGTPIKCFNKAWWHTLEIAGIKDFHFHDLRHTFCSNLIMSGGDLKDAKEMIGHSDISMTDRYTHISVQHMTNRQEKLALHYNEGL